MKPFLLITNDDGIHAPGLKHLWQSVCEYAEVAIIAPHAEKSGCGTATTWTQPLHLHPVPWELNTPAWSLDGTPADCVKMALSVILEKQPTMVISGINRGSNSGSTVLYSGTVGGVIEAVLKGIPGISFSFSDLAVPPLSVTQKYIFPLIQHFLEHPLPKGTLLNVNFPYHSKERIKGLKMAKQGKSYWKESPDKRMHPRGTPYYWLGGIWGTLEEDPTSDVAYLDQGYVTAVPIHVAELTCEASLQKYKTLTEQKFNPETQ